MRKTRQLKFIAFAEDKHGCHEDTLCELVTHPEILFVGNMLSIKISFFVSGTKLKRDKVKVNYVALIDEDRRIRSYCEITPFEFSKSNTASGDYFMDTNKKCFVGKEIKSSVSSMV